MAYRASQFAFAFILSFFAIESSNNALMAATLPAGFTESQFASGLSSPTAMAFAPDGRLFVCQQGGQLRVIKNGALLITPFLTATVDSSSERGLLGIAFDPNFNANHYIYVYYTATTPAIHNRVSRFTANGDVAVANSETVLLDLNDLSIATNHNGGAMHFGPDGKLYVAVGENANSANSQTLVNLLGKILRLNADGTIPTDNPFYNQATNNNRFIWALGLRNPYTFAFQNNTGRMFINDVGQGTWEEINDGIGGSNYGWPSCEGICSKTGFRNPLFEYGHGSTSTTGCAITGGAFYNPTTNQFPADYAGKYFFADYCGGWIRRFDPATGAATDFATGINAPVDLQVTDDGALYYLARGASAVYKVQYPTNQAPPTITQQPQNQTVAAGQTATFISSATGSTPLAFQWQRNGVDISGANASSYTTPPVSSSDNGAVFRVVVKNSFGTATSNTATLTVTAANTAPNATITAPASGALYSAGETINFAGTATDAEDGTLAASAFTWRVDFQHDTHAHPFVPATTNIKNGSFTASTTGETSANVWYRIYLTVTDSGGLSQTVTRDVFPRKANITLVTNPAGLQTTLDGQPQATPVTVQSVVGITRTLGVVSPQTINGVTYDFTSWSDGGGVTHDISTPARDTIYTATFTARQALPPPVALQFDAASYRVSEGGASASVNVSRTGDASSVVTVDYQTSDNTASQRTDYTLANGTLTFAAGETTKSFVVLITDNGRVDGDRTINLSLSNSSGASLGAQRTALLTINDNDTAQPTTNPIDDTGDFVRQHYYDFLNRLPDEGGFAYWTNLIGQCSSTDAQCLNSKRASVSAAFFIEQEFQETGSFVYRFYKAAYGQRPTYTQFMPDRSRVTGGANLEAGKQAFAEAFVLRPEFIAKYPATLSPTAFVDALLQTMRQGSAVDLSSQRDALINDYTVNKNRARVLQQLVDDATFKQAEYNNAFVLMQYFGYLRREPDAGGYQFWLDVLNNKAQNNYRGMVCAFLTSAEYQDRFSSIRTRNDSVCGQIGQ